MAEHLYEVSLTKTTGAAAGFICTIVPGALGAGIRPPEIREIGITNVSGVAAEVGIGIPAAAGVTPSGALTVQPLNQLDPAGHTQLVPTYTTAPTAPANPYRRFQVQALAGAGDIFTWLPGEFTLWSGAAVNQVVLWQFSASAVTYDVYVKVAE
jgi:hypothetical protein